MSILAKINELLAGKKTYLVAAVLALGVFAQYSGWITKEQHDTLISILFPAGLLTLRAAIK